LGPGLRESTYNKPDPDLHIIKITSLEKEEYNAIKYKKPELLNMKKLINNIQLDPGVQLNKSKIDPGFSLNSEMITGSFKFVIYKFKIKTK